MNNRAYDLDQTERWMQTVIMYAGGVRRGVALDAARRHVDVPVDEIEKVVTRSRVLTAEARLGIYSRAYRGRLLECLRAEFPVLLHALGEELFDRFGLDYLERHPSQHYTLARLGEEFPLYLSETRPDRDAREDWPDFIIDLATLERAFSEVYDGPGVEGRSLVARQQLRELSQTPRFQQARLVTVPCLRLLTLRYPVNSYFVAVRMNENPELPGPHPTFIAMTRTNYSVFFHDLTQQQYELLSALIAGEPVAQAVNRLAEITISETCAMPESVFAFLENWATLGFFLAMEPSDPARRE